MQGQLSTLQAMVKDLCRRSKGGDGGPDRDLPDELFRLFTDLLDVDLSEEVARGLVERVRAEFHDTGFDDPVMLKARVAGMLEAEILVSGPIQVVPGRCRVAVLVGPTGVGKTTTIAKLAANFRLKEKRRVGLITVDTYRIAAVEQLRTYADIIDLPMLVVSSPREMREAVDRMSHLDLVLMDTAGRSPRDEVRVQELQLSGGSHRRRSSSGAQQRGGHAHAGRDGPAVYGHRRHVAHSDQVGRSHRFGQRVAHVAIQRFAAELLDQRPERARRHRNRRGAARSRHDPRRPRDVIIPDLWPLTPDL